MIFRNKIWINKLNKLNVKDNSLWKMTKALKKQFEPIPTLKNYAITAMTDRQKVNILADHYEQVHVIDMNNSTKYYSKQSKLIY